jgi:hypothetical protein
LHLVHLPLPHRSTRTVRRRLLRLLLPPRRPLLLLPPRWQTLRRASVRRTSARQLPLHLVRLLLLLPLPCRPLLLPRRPLLPLRRPLLLPRRPRLLHLVRLLLLQQPERPNPLGRGQRRARQQTLTTGCSKPSRLKKRFVLRPPPPPMWQKQRWRIEARQEVGVAALQRRRGKRRMPLSTLNPSAPACGRQPMATSAGSTAWVRCGEPKSRRVPLRRPLLPVSQGKAAVSQLCQPRRLRPKLLRQRLQLALLPTDDPSVHRK